MAEKNILTNIEDEESTSFNLRTIFTIIYLNWYWVVLSIILSVAAAKIYLRYTPPVYSAGMKVFIKSEGGNNTKRAGGLDEMGVISNTNGFANELEILKSAAIATRTVRSLKLYTTYRLEGKIADRELYSKESPILVDITEESLDNLGTNVNIVINKKGQGIHVKGNVGGKNHFSHDLKELPATIQTAVGPLMFQRNPNAHMEDGKSLYVTIAPPINKGRQFAGKLTAGKAGDGTTVANIRIQDTQMGRMLDYLSELMISYNDDANEDKNEIAEKTEKFIKERIEVIRRELDSTEISLETFKKENDMINLPNNASLAFSNSEGYRKQQVDNQMQLTLVNALIDYTGNPENIFQVIPSNLGLGNAQLNASISEYNSLVMQRKHLLKSSTEANPTIQRLTAQIEDIWPNISSSLKAMHQELLMEKNSIDAQRQIFTSQVANTPTQERILNNMGRQQDIKAGLYLMLLQKREQNFISLVSTATKARVIDAPKAMGKVSPDDQKIMLIALVFGFLFPIALFYILSMMRYRIEGRDDVESLTKLPILVDVPMAKKDEGGSDIVVSANKNNMMEEAFRGLRTNLRFVMPEPEKVVLCTSCIPGEGKTFIASNLAMSLSLLGKHVLLVGLDIRKPRLVKMFGLDKKKKGITSFLMLDKPDYELLEEQITRNVGNDNLDVLPAGIIPPNPTELISRPLLDDAINYLRTKYDYIILDTPPVGLVTDTLEIARTADATVFVCRSEYSIKANFKLINEIHREQKMPKMNMVLNGVDLAKKKYAYYYGYGRYGSYGKSSKYGYYGRYSHYGHYGVYGSYHNSDKSE